MKLGTHMPDGERRKPIDIEVCRSKVKVTLSIHMFATQLSHLWCVTDFSAIKDYRKIDTNGKYHPLPLFHLRIQRLQIKQQ